MDEQEKNNEQLPPTPVCFDSDVQWSQYRLFWKLSQGSSPPRICVDCTPEYRDQMSEQGRCAHPETVFIKQTDGETIGVDGLVWSSWVSAITGKRGIVLSKPNKRVLDSFMQSKFGASFDGGQHLLNKRPMKALRAQKSRERRAAMRDRAMEMRAQGMPFSLIASELGVSEETARTYGMDADQLARRVRE